ncbi:MAG TPA: type 4a pilus biogenesis protein PilO [Nitrospiria bacterium]
MKLAEILKKLDLTKLNTRDMILTIAALVAVLFAIAGYIFIPTVREERHLSAQRLVLKGEIVQGMDQIPVLQKRYEDLRRAAQNPEAGGDPFGTAPGLQSFDSRWSGVLEKLTRLAHLSRVEVVSVRPEAIEDKNGYFELTLDFNVQSRFRDLGEYLQMLENPSRDLVVRDLRIETQAEVAPAVRGQMKIITYLDKE